MYILVPSKYILSLLFTSNTHGLHESHSCKTNRKLQKPKWSAEGKNWCKSVPEYCISSISRSPEGLSVWVITNPLGSQEHTRIWKLVWFLRYQNVRFGALFNK